MQYSNLLVSYLASITFVPGLFIILCLLSILWRRRRTHIQLSSGTCNLPTVFWRPRFLNYSPLSNDINNRKSLFKKMASTQTLNSPKMGASSITNILTRMEKLKGPYGMYATVYGISTKVVHVAHPFPARCILTGVGSIKDHNNGKQKYPQKQRKKFVLGATKAPGYDHFKNMFGDGVFTADGKTWKAKRTSVIHCLLRGCTTDSSAESLRLQREANRAADDFISHAMPNEESDEGHCRYNSEANSKLCERSSCNFCERKKPLNVVPILQKSTIGLIYRFITHDEEDIYEKEGFNPKLRNRKVEMPEENYDTTSTCSSSSSVSYSPYTDEIIDKATKHIANVHGKVTLEQSPSNHQKLPSVNHSRSSNHTSKQTSELLSSYLDAVTNMRMIILAQSRSLWFFFPRWVYRLFSSMYREEEKYMSAIRTFAHNSIANCQPGSPLSLLNERSSHKGKDNNTIDSASIGNGKSGGCAIFSKSMMDEAITLLFAGQDTSAATLSWTLHLLGLYPNIQRLVAEEVLKSVNNSTCELKDGETLIVTKKMIDKMPYLDAVIKESMRLYPVAPFVLRRITETLVIPSPSPDGCESSFTLPADTFACIWIYGLHRNKKFWHRPDDFLPERWIDPELRQLDAAQGNGIGAGAYMPFASGPRSCVGQPLANVLIRIMLARIIMQCDIVDHRVDDMSGKLFNEEDILYQTKSLRKEMQAGFTVLPQDGVWQSLHKRKHLEKHTS